MELRDYVLVLRRHWLLVLVLAALGAGLAGAAALRATPMYSASVTMVVSSPTSSDNLSAAYQGDLLSQQRVKSYADLVASERVAAGVITQLKLNESPAALRGQISAQAVPDTVLLRATVTDRSAERATQIADAVGTVFSSSVAQIENVAGSRDAPPSSSVRVTVWEQAKPPTAPVSPKPTRTIGLGLLLGLVIGIGAAILRSRFDTTVKDEDDVRGAVDLPVLGTICFEPDGARRPLVVHGSPHSRRAEAFRQLRTNLRFADVDARPRTIIITSSLPAEGKTTTSCNLAITLAQAGARVVLVEGDLRRPSFDTYLGVESSVGLTSVLIGAAELEDVLQPWGDAGSHQGRFDVLPSGPVPPNPSELLGSRGMFGLLADLGERYDTVLVDAPPLLPVTDAAVLGAQADGVLLVTRVGRTRRPQLAHAAEALRAVDARMLGVVLNMVPTKGADAYHYGYATYQPRARHSRTGSDLLPPVPALAGATGEPNAGAHSSGAPSAGAHSAGAHGAGAPSAGAPSSGGPSAGGPVDEPAIPVAAQRGRRDEETTLLVTVDPPTDPRRAARSSEA